jgi:hypothetical protein
MIIADGFDQNQQYLQTVKEFRLELSRDVFNNGIVDIHLCNPYMKTLKVVNGR